MLRTLGAGIPVDERGWDDPGGRAPAEAMRRVEDWVACNLDPSARRDRGGSGDWFPGVAESPTLTSRATGPGRAPAASAKGWAQIVVAKRRGVAVVRLRAEAIVKDTVVREVADDLGGLIEAGHRRIALDFSGVERLSSLILPALDDASRRCAAEAGGALKLFGLGPQVSQVVSLAAPAGTLAVVADEAEAIDGPWPEASGPRPLPEALIVALNGSRISAAAPGPGGSRAGALRAPRPAVAEGRAEAPGRVDAADPIEPWPHLVVESGRHVGRIVPLDVTELFIGRGPTCRVRLGCLDVSRTHASVRAAGGRVWVRDLGSTNGTILNDRVLKGEEAEARDGDVLEIGPYRFQIALNRPAPAGAVRPAPSGEEVGNWLSGAFRPGAPDRTMLNDDGTAESLRLEDLHGEALRCEVIEETLVVVLLASQISDGATLDALRSELVALLERPLPPRVVVDLRHVAAMSSAAVGVLVAHHFMLGRVGGTLRLCVANPRVGALLDAIRLPMVLDIYPSVDEAILEAWDRPRPDGGGIAPG